MTELKRKHALVTASSITLHDLTLEWPDGAPALIDVNGSFNAGRTGLIGRNGSGKSTLLRLIAGELAPTGGHVFTSGAVGYLPQTLTPRQDSTVAGLLGIEPILTAMHAIESGDLAQSHFDTIGDDWDIEARCAEALHQIGFSTAEMDRRVAELSGGECMILAITGLLIRHAPITLLDEPTNNLDRNARTKLTQLVDEWPGTLVVVSHDVDLLEHMDTIAELHAGRLRSFGGPYSAWKQHQERQQSAAIQAARTAHQALKVEERQRVQAETKLARRERTGKKMKSSGSIPKILLGNRVSRARASAGSLRSTLDERVRSAQNIAEIADARVRVEDHINITLPDPNIPRGRHLAELRDESRTFVIRGPERVALIGANGTGKSTLLESLINGSKSPHGRSVGRLLTNRFGYLPQRIAGLDENVSAIANVQAVAKSTPSGTIRNQLARMLLRGDTVDRQVRTLSGGERFRVRLAQLLLADPPAELLILDEPTNDLDIPSVEQLAEALDAFRGALLVVSHDFTFLQRISVDTVLELDTNGCISPRTDLSDRA